MLESSNAAAASLNFARTRFIGSLATSAQINQRGLVAPQHNPQFSMVDMLKYEWCLDALVVKLIYASWGEVMQMHIVWVLIFIAIGPSVAMTAWLIWHSSEPAR